MGRRKKAVKKGKVAKIKRGVKKKEDGQGKKKNPQGRASRGVLNRLGDLADGGPREKKGGKSATCPPTDREECKRWGKKRGKGDWP